MRRLKWIATLLLAVFLLAACTSKPTATPDSKEPAKPAAPQGPVKLVVGAPQDIFTWDPQDNNYNYTFAVEQHIFDQLVYQNLDTGKIEPGLATEWKMEDPSTWSFTLRSGVKFQNGDPFTAADVKFTLERVSRDTKLRVNSSFRTIKEVQIVDDLHIKIITTGPDPILLNRLSTNGSPIVPAKYFQQVGPEGFAKAPIGTGAYKFKEWKKDSYLDIVAWPDGWRGKAKVDEILFRVIPEESTRVAELQSGGIDIALYLSPSTVQSLKSDPNIDIRAALTPRVELLNLRFTKGAITANPKIREAIDFAIDRQALIDAAIPSMAVPTNTRITPGLIGFSQKYYNVNNYNLDKAKQALKDAGYPNGGAPIELLAPNSDTQGIAAQTITGMLEKAGFKVKLDLLDPLAFQDKFDTNTNPELSLHSNMNPLNDPDQVAFRFLPARAAKKWDWNNPQLTDLVNKAAQEMDPAKRQSLYEQISAIVADEREQIYLWHEKAAHGVRKGISWTPRPDDTLWLNDVTKTTK